MPGSNSHYRYLVTEMSRINTLREKLAVDALTMLEVERQSLAGMLVENLGGRRKAERWMFAPQRAFGGSTALDLLAEGDEDPIWDELARLGETSA